MISTVIALPLRARPSPPRHRRQQLADKLSETSTPRVTLDRAIGSADKLAGALLGNGGIAERGAERLERSASSSGCPARAGGGRRREQARETAAPAVGRPRRSAGRPGPCRLGPGRGRRRRGARQAGGQGEGREDGRDQEGGRRRAGRKPHRHDRAAQGARRLRRRGEEEGRAAQAKAELDEARETKQSAARPARMPSASATSPRPRSRSASRTEPLAPGSDHGARAPLPAYRRGRDPGPALDRLPDEPLRRRAARCSRRALVRAPRCPTLGSCWPSTRTWPANSASTLFVWLRPPLIGLRRAVRVVHPPPGAMPVAHGLRRPPVRGLFAALLGDGRALLLGQLIDREGPASVTSTSRGRAERGSRAVGTGRPRSGRCCASTSSAKRWPPSASPPPALAVVATGDGAPETHAAWRILTRVAEPPRVGTSSTPPRSSDTDRWPVATTPSPATTPRGRAERVSGASPSRGRTPRRPGRPMDPVGFIHGVMNTDNMSISGETIDYGPCAFMDRYDPATVFSSIDRGGRYAYGNQPGRGVEPGAARRDPATAPRTPIRSGRRRRHGGAREFPHDSAVPSSPECETSSDWPPRPRPTTSRCSTDLPLWSCCTQQVDSHLALPGAFGPCCGRCPRARPSALRRAGSFFDEWCRAVAAAGRR